MAVANPEEEIDQTKAPLLEHLVELRRRLIYSVIAISLCFVFCYVFSNHIYNFLLIPYKIAVGGENPHIKLVYTALEGKFVTDVRVAFFGAIALSFPVLASQLYMFVAPGLYRNERRAFLPFLIATPALFLIGGAIVFFIVMPLAVRFFLFQQQTGDIEIEAPSRRRQLPASHHDLYSGVRPLLPTAGVAHPARACGNGDLAVAARAMAICHRSYFCGCSASCAAGRAEPGCASHPNAASL